MKNLITITEKDGYKIVSAKELYLGLGLNKTNWSRWYPSNIENNEFFIETVDWIGVRHNDEGNETMDFAISIEFAKHIAMQAKTEKSHEYRQYFIACEKQLVEIQSKAQMLLDIYNGGQAGIVASKKLTEIEVKEATVPLLNTIEEQKPLVAFSNTVLKSKDNILIRELAKIISDEVISIGQNRLYDKLRAWNMIMPGKTEPYQRCIDNGYFVVEEKTVSTSYGEKIVTTTLVSPKGQVSIVEKFRKEFDKKVVDNKNEKVS